MGTRRGIPGPPVVAVDWSSAVNPSAQRKHIWTAELRADGSIGCSAGRTREETIDLLVARPGAVLAGLDFSFSVPAWFAGELGVRSVDEVWEWAATDGDAWLAECRPPFWGKGPRVRCDVPADRRYRVAEEGLRAAGFPAKSVFQLVGNGQVGAGSVRGMPHLARLRAEGFAIWPFDAPTERTIFEIYPSALRRWWCGGDSDLPETARVSRDARDAAVSAVVMGRHRDELAAAMPLGDPVTRLEGAVWLPASREEPPH
jgi:hypothetical protein